MEATELSEEILFEFLVPNESENEMLTATASGADPNNELKEIICEKMGFEEEVYKKLYGKYKYNYINFAFWP